MWKSTRESGAPDNSSLSRHFSATTWPRVDGMEEAPRNLIYTQVRYPGLSRDPMHRLQKTYLKGKGGPLVVIGLIPPSTPTTQSTTSRGTLAS